jgi:hypothetical protein
MDGKMIAAGLDPERLLGKTVTVMAEPKERYPYGTSREDKASGKAKPEGHSLKIGSSVLFENFNIKLPLGADFTGIKVHDQVVLVEPVFTLRGKADGDFVNLDVFIEAKGVRKAAQ